MKAHKFTMIKMISYRNKIVRKTFFSLSYLILIVIMIVDNFFNDEQITINVWSIFLIIFAVMVLFSFITELRDLIIEYKAVKRNADKQSYFFVKESGIYFKGNIYNHEHLYDFEISEIKFNKLGNSISIWSNSSFIFSDIKLYDEYNTPIYDIYTILRDNLKKHNN